MEYSNLHSHLQQFLPSICQENVSAKLTELKANYYISDLSTFLFAM